MCLYILCKIQSFKKFKQGDEIANLHFLRTACHVSIGGKTGVKKPVWGFSNNVHEQY